MPFHLWPTGQDPTRREFLGTIARTGVAAAVGGGLARGNTDEAPGWFALVSDPHIAGDLKKRTLGHVMAENFKAVVADILAVKSKPEGVLFNGDIAALTGEAADYDAFLGLVEPLRKASIPLHFVMGNHDDRKVFRDALKRAGVDPSSALEDKFVGGFEALGHRFVLLDSLDGVNVGPGLLGLDQLNWLAKDLDEHPKTPTLVFVHHNPNKRDKNSPADDSHFSGLKDDRELFGVIQSRRWVKALIFGHTHTWTHAREKDIRLVNLPAVAYTFAAKQPLGYCRFRLREGRACFELRALRADTAKDGEKWPMKWRV